MTICTGVWVALATLGLLVMLTLLIAAHPALRRYEPELGVRVLIILMTIFTASTFILMPGLIWAYIATTFY